MFSEMDTNNNGFISFEELKTGLHKRGSQLSENEIHQLMDAVSEQFLYSLLLIFVGNGSCQWGDSHPLDCRNRILFVSFSTLLFNIRKCIGASLFFLHHAYQLMSRNVIDEGHEIRCTTKRLMWHSTSYIRMY